MKKKIDMKDVVGSPYFTSAILMLIIVGLIAGLVLFTLDINKTKVEITKAKEAYALNMQEIQILERLREDSKVAEAKLAEYDGILPSELGDVYIYEENFVKGLENFGLKVNSCSFSQVQAQTKETSFTVNISGKYNNIHSYMNYVASQKQLQRVDSATFTVDSEGMYIADIVITILSEYGASGVSDIDAAA